ncbi:hypothetical protein OROHE_009486 [Orobanche hederae]
MDLAIDEEVERMRVEDEDEDEDEDDKPKCTRFVPKPDQPCTYIVNLRFPASAPPDDLEEWYRSFIPKDVILEPPRWFLASNPKFHVGFCALLTLEEVEAMRKENKPGFVRAFMEGPLVLH